MSAFLSPLQAEILHGSGPIRWVLTSSLIYQSDLLRGAVCVPKAFVTDLASVPRLPLVYMLTANVVSEPAVIHDYLYATATVPRDTADRVFLEAMAVAGVSWLRRQAMYLAVRAFGWRYYGGRP